MGKRDGGAARPLAAIVGDRSARLADTKIGASLRPLSELDCSVVQSKPGIGDVVFAGRSCAAELRCSRRSGPKDGLLGFIHRHCALRLDHLRTAKRPNDIRQGAMIDRLDALIPDRGYRPHGPSKIACFALSNRSP
jgi:hypothetical protein